MTSLPPSTTPIVGPTVQTGRSGRFQPRGGRGEAKVKGRPGASKYAEDAAKAGMTVREYRAHLFGATKRESAAPDGVTRGAVRGNARDRVFQRIMRVATGYHREQGPSRAPGYARDDEEIEKLEVELLARELLVSPGPVRTYFRFALLEEQLVAASQAQDSARFVKLRDRLEAVKTDIGLFEAADQSFNKAVETRLKQIKSISREGLGRLEDKVRLQERKADFELKSWLDEDYPESVLPSLPQAAAAASAPAPPKAAPTVKPVVVPAQAPARPHPAVVPIPAPQPATQPLATQITQTKLSSRTRPGKAERAAQRAAKVVAEPVARAGSPVSVVTEAPAAAQAAAQDGTQTSVGQPDPINQGPFPETYFPVGPQMLHVYPSSESPNSTYDRVYRVDADTPTPWYGWMLVALAALVSVVYEVWFVLVIVGVFFVREAILALRRCFVGVTTVEVDELGGARRTVTVRTLLSAPSGCSYEIVYGLTTCDEAAYIHAPGCNHLNLDGPTDFHVLGCLGGFFRDCRLLVGDRVYFHDLPQAKGLQRYQDTERVVYRNASGIGYIEPNPRSLLNGFTRRGVSVERLYSATEVLFRVAQMPDNEQVWVSGSPRFKTPPSNKLGGGGGKCDIVCPALPSNLAVLDTVHALASKEGRGLGVQRVVRRGNTEIDANVSTSLIEDTHLDAWFIERVKTI